MDFQGNKLAANLCDDESPDTSDLTRDRETWRKFRLERQRFTNTARARMQSEESQLRWREFPRELLHLA